MAVARINHMELTFAEGSLTPALKREIGEFYQALFGWNSLEVEIVGQQALLLMLDDEVSQFILCAESPKPIHAPGYDHMGLLYASREEVDALLARAKELQAADSRVQIKEYEDLSQWPATVHAFYVRHLLPIWLDVQSIDYAPGSAPPRQWWYG